jgi:hypothetical protein
MPGGAMRTMRRGVGSWLLVSVVGVAVVGLLGTALKAEVIVANAAATPQSGRPGEGPQDWTRRRFLGRAVGLLGAAALPGVAPLASHAGHGTSRAGLVAEPVLALRCYVGEPFRGKPAERVWLKILGRALELVRSTAPNSGSIYHRAQDKDLLIAPSGLLDVMVTPSGDAELRGGVFPQLLWPGGLQRETLGLAYGFAGPTPLSQIIAPGAPAMNAETQVRSWQRTGRLVPELRERGITSKPPLALREIGGKLVVLADHVTVPGPLGEREIAETVGRVTAAIGAFSFGLVGHLAFDPMLVDASCDGRVTPTPRAAEAARGEALRVLRALRGEVRLDLALSEVERGALGPLIEALERVPATSMGPVPSWVFPAPCDQDDTAEEAPEAFGWPPRDGRGGSGSIGGVEI